MSKRKAGSRAGRAVSEWSSEAIRFQRLRSCGLFRRFATPTLATAALIGVQSQEVEASSLALWNRVERKLTADHCRDLLAHPAQSSEVQAPLVRLWGQRGTLHLYSAADWHLIAAVIGEKLIEGRKASIEKANQLDEFNAALAATKQQLQEDEVVSTEAVTLDVRRGVHMTLTSQGFGSRVDVRAGRAILRRRDEAIAPWPSISQSDATRAVVLRYFAAYGPATEKDVRFWLGVKARQTKVAVEELVATGDLVPITREECAKEESSGGGDDDQITFPNGEMYAISGMESPPEVPPHSTWPVRLLGRFEPVLLAHADKSFLVAASSKPKVWAPSAQVHAVVLVGGRLSGRWSKTVKRGVLTVTVDMFADTASRQRLENADVRRTVQAEADSLAVFYACATPATVNYTAA
jgi:hypothetical protein